jgi:hypothetical protein
VSVCPCNGNVVEQQGRAALGLTAAGCSLRSVLAGLAAMLTLSGCGTFLNPVPVNPPAASAGPPVPSPAPVVCQLHETIAQLVYLQGLGVEEQRREHLAAQQAFLADPSEANWLRLILTLSRRATPGETTCGSTIDRCARCGRARNRLHGRSGFCAASPLIRSTSSPARRAATPRCPDQGRAAQP